MENGFGSYFYRTYCGEEIYGKFHYLLGHAITTFRYFDQWEEELMPYLESIANKTGVIDDWSSFDWEGTICFRDDHVLIVDRSHTCWPSLKDENGNVLKNYDGENLLDTMYFKANCEEFVYISLDQFIKLCKIWMDKGADKIENEM